MAEVDVEVVVMGGGVAGCSVVHRLLAGGMPGNRIALIERLPELGGVARSSAIPNTGHDGRSDLPTEYSWRVLGGDYVVVRSILRDIPDPEPVSDALARSWKEKQQSQTQSQRHGTAPLPRTALANWDTLPDPWMVGTTVVRDDADDEQDSVVTEELPQMASVKDASLWSSAPFLRRLSMVQTVRLWWRVLYGFSACRARRSVELSRVSWYDYMDADELPSEAKDIIVRIVAPLLGADLYQASVSSVLEYLEGWSTMEGETMVSRCPTSDAWFRPWRRYLESHGVRIYTSTEVVRLDEADESSDSLRHVVCRSLPVSPRGSVEHDAVATTAATSTTAAPPPATTWILTAHWFASALPAIQTARILSARNGPRIHRLVRALHRLGELQSQEMIGVQLYWQEAIPLQLPVTGLFLMDTPWSLLVEPQAAVWARSRNAAAWSANLQDHYGDGTLHDLWTVTLCDQRTPSIGLPSPKPWPLCSRDELSREVWHQLQSSKLLASQYLALHGESWTRIAPPVRIEPWYSFQTSTGNSNNSNNSNNPRRSLDPPATLQTWEPKSSPNAGTRELRPCSVKDGSLWRNLLWAGVWVAGPIEMHRMETAASNGFAAAETILRYDAEGRDIRFTGHGASAVVMRHRSPSPRAWSGWFGIVREMDALCFAVGAPHALTLLFLGFVCYLTVRML